MRVIVPLQGIVQGSGSGLVLGSIIPCALYYFLQLYLKYKHNSDDTATTVEPPPEISPPSSSGGGLQRSHSVRSIWSPRGTNGQHAQVSSRGNFVIKQNDTTSYYVGLENVYDEISNPDGVIQLGFDENKVCGFNVILHNFFFI